MPSNQQHLVDAVRQHLADLYRIRSAPCDIRYVSHLHNCRVKLDRLSAFLDTEYHYRLELALMRFERRRLKARFENHCRICGLYTGTIFRICECCMPAGHERQQESAQIKRTSHDLPIPRPRYQPEAKHPQNSSQRFLRRFGAGDTLATPNTPSRAMKNPLFTASQLALPSPQGDTVSVSPNEERTAPASQGLTDVSRSPFGETETVLPHAPDFSVSAGFPSASQFPPAYIPSPKVVGVFSFQVITPRFWILRGVVLRVAGPVTPPLSPMGGTFRTKNDQYCRFLSPAKGGKNAD